MPTSPIYPGNVNVYFLQDHKNVTNINTSAKALIFRPHVLQLIAKYIGKFLLYILIYTAKR